MSEGHFRRLSPPGEAALSLWEIRGEAGLASRLGLPEAFPGRPRRVRLRDADGTLLDEGVLLVLEEGRAGLWRAELHLHGGEGVAASLRRCLREAGLEEEAPPADPDRCRFWRARSSLDARTALAVLRGRVDPALAALAGGPAPAGEEARRWRRRLRWGRLLEQPPRVVLAGPPNAGKSTLFNAWLREERVTVSPWPGTTRDPVRARFLLPLEGEDLEIELVDTAGLGAACDPLDRAAAEAACREIEGAWRVLWVLDASSEPAPELAARVAARGPGDRLLWNRADLGLRPGTPEGPERPDFTGAGGRRPQELLPALEDWLRGELGPPPGPEEPVPRGEDRLRRLARLLGEPDPGDRG